MEILSKRSLLRGSILLYLGLIFLLPHCAKKEKESVLAPDFTLKTLDDQQITLSNLKGKVILLDFWATWCTPCRESIPHLAHLHRTFQKEGLEIIGMNLDKGDIETVRRFAKAMEIPYPIVITPEEVSRNFGVTALPTAVFIDKEGKVREKIVGFNNVALTAKVTELTSGNP